MPKRTFRPREVGPEPPPDPDELTVDNLAGRHGQQGENSKLTRRQQLFVYELARCGDERQAARKAGAPPQLAARLAKQWLTSPHYRHVAKAAREELARLGAECRVEAKQIVNELARVGFADPRRFVDEEGNPLPLHRLPPEVAATVKKFKVSMRYGTDSEGQPAQVKVTEVETWNKLDALKQLAQHLGLLKEVTQNINILALDWPAILGQRPPAALANPAAADDPVEARIAAAEQAPRLPASGPEAQARQEMLRRLESLHTATENGTQTPDPPAPDHTVQ